MGEGAKYGYSDEAWEKMLRDAYERKNNGHQNDLDLTGLDWKQYDSGSRQWSGLPSWAQGFAKNWLGGYGDKSFAGLQKSMDDLNNAERFIGQQRRLTNRQYARDIQAPTMQAIGSAVGSATGKGTGSSSMANSWMGRIGQQMAQGAQQAHNAGNLWAAGANLNALGTRAQANQGYAGLMGQILGQTRESSGSSWNPFNPFGAGLGFAPPAYGTYDYES